jgi:hypothetical protein
MFTVYVPVPPVPVTNAVMTVPAITPAATTICPTARVPLVTPVTVIVVPEIEAVTMAPVANPVGFCVA